MLERVDPAWEIAGHANRKFELGWPPSVWLLGLLPLALPAVLAYRRRAEGWQDWPCACCRWPWSGSTS